MQLVSPGGTITREYRYDAFGNEINPSEDDVNPWRFCGEYFDKETGNIYLRARYYNPRTGRFGAEDPHWHPGNMIYGNNPVRWNERTLNMRDPSGLTMYTFKPDVTAVMQSGNLYAYCINNPVMWQDPSGEIIVTSKIVFITLAFKLKSGVVATMVVGKKVYYTSSLAIGRIIGTLGPAIYKSWQMAEQAMRQAYGVVKHTFGTPLGKRIVDGWDRTRGVIHEVKYGYQSLTSRIQMQILKDRHLLENHREVNEVVWHFHRSMETGAGGASQPLIDALKRAGFRIIYCGCGLLHTGQPKRGRC